MSTPHIHNLEVVQVPVEEISQHPENANVGDIVALEKSIEVNGFFSPVLVQASTGYIIAGNHRWQAATSLGMDTIPVIYLDVPDSEAKRMMIADNRITRLGHDDPESLAGLLEQLSETDYGLMGTGYTSSDLQTLLDSLDVETGYGEESPAEPSEAEFGPLYVIEPIIDANRECDSVVVRREDGSALVGSDLNAIRSGLGLKKLSASALDGLGIEGWR